MKKELLKRIIRDFHLSSLPSLHRRSKDVPLDSGKIVTLVGVRRCGKTSYLFCKIAELLARDVPRTKILYTNFEDERLDLQADELDLLLQAYRELYPDIRLEECYFFFDEIQNVEGWDVFVRRVYDTVTKNIFITGSNSRFLSSEIATSLRGRTVRYEVFPLSFREFLSFKGITPDLYSSRSIALVNHHLTDYLQHGGFPEVVDYDDGLRNRVLQEYFNVMIYRDLLERYQIRNLPALRFFLKRLIASATSQVSVNNIYNELKSAGFKAGKNQLYDFLEACQQIHLTLVLRKHTTSLVERELGEKKVYAIDNGLLKALSYRFSEDMGKFLEQTVFLELRRREKDVWFFKDKAECDFVVKDGFNVTEAIQVTVGLEDEKTRKRELRGLVACCHACGLKEGLIVTRDTAAFLEADGVKVTVVPLYQWLLAEEGGLTPRAVRT
ncbi:ATP-binding protein [Geobacter pickeringii]|uniref:ATP-binding protein n=1 Tax=Geobacter pickeringii TaxID=345632 RepID=UPI000689F589|nr:ATP-binding protein [Geobacter pickeringii]